LGREKSPFSFQRRTHVRCYESWEQAFLTKYALNNVCGCRRFGQRLVSQAGTVSPTVNDMGFHAIASLRRRDINFFEVPAPSFWGLPGGVGIFFFAHYGHGEFAF